ncbi:uncharacterized protein LOC112456003 isoform X1 [Temnothorax curvispinosus]|uniref:Uncharacterized protein LOC112456003 isoform X1 n=2 Tax=Temnothorax curvispinosus TaxID=300111 RepID=A0A6J1PXV2_9HYME|nr:uncharacterized protein LOC112456003 isoform X1 [Temnothorax curvispinosus]XP_024874036.1 uncharacterized protein LOC112456003 isoform X1 [Temnothorax curvispinosus]
MSSDESNSTFYKKKHNISESNVDSIIDLEVRTHQSTASSSSSSFSSFFDNLVRICEVRNTQGSLGICNILRRCVESPVRLYMIKEEALLYGHDIIFRELLNSRPEVTGKMILEVCRLLEISPLEIDNQLEYIKLILERGFRKTMDVCSVNGISSLDHLIMIKKEALLYGHDIIFCELLNSRPEVTGKMILEVCRLLEISPLEIDNQLEYIKLILGQEFRETVDVRSVDGALADLNMIKKKTLLYGHDIIFRKLHNSWPEVTNKMILEVCRLLEISPLEIDNQLEYIKLILGRGFRKTMDVRSVDGPFAHLNMIKKEVHGHDIILRELLNSRPEVTGALAHLKMIKKEALLYGHDIIFRELLNSQPEVTGKMILEVCRLLEISPLEIDNQLEYIKLILGRGFRKTMDVRSVDGISSLAHLNMIKKEALLYGHDIIFRELLNSRPEVTGKMILEVCRLLEISPLEIDNQLEYIKLILGRGLRKNMDVCFVDGISSLDHLIMIKKEAFLYGHDIIFCELLNSRPEVTGKMILEVCRLLEISPLEIDNQLEYIKLILGQEFRETVDVRSVDGALADLNMIKKEAFLYGHDIIFRKLRNSWPDVTNKMILEVCRLLEISPLEIDNQLEYINLILGRGFKKTMNVRSVDGALAHLKMIKEEILLYGHDIIFRELLNSRPDVTGKMILEVCRLLEISPLEIDNQLEYIKLILGQGFRKTMDVRSVDGALAHLNMIKKEVLLYGHDIIFRELLNPRPEVTVVTRSKMILEVCRLLEISPLEIDNQLEYIKLILGKGFRETMDVRSVDGLGNTPLHYALERNWYEAATLLLKQGSYLGQVNKFNNIVIANIPEFILSSYFNDCIQLRKEWTDGCTIEFDYRCLMPYENFGEQQKISRATCEMGVILYIANNDALKHLLRHPLISSFLYIKWYMIRHVFYANFVFYTMFYFFVNAYILSMTYDTSSRNRQQIAKDSSNTLQNNLSFLAMGMLLLFTYREILQFCPHPEHYLADLKNWSQVLLILLTFALLCGAGRQIWVMVILLSTWELMTLISHHLFPSCIEMFRTVFSNFVRFFFSYLILILAFTIAFNILLRNDGFSDSGLSLFKTIIMFTGEFDANDISFSVYPVWSRIVFVLFIFYIVIVLFNLLNGLAISNIAEILNKAEIIGLISRVRLVACFEKMTVGKPFCWNSKWTWSNPFNFFSKKVLLFPHYLKCGKISFKPYDDNLIVYDGDRHNVDGYSMDWSTLKMDPNIVKHAKQVVYEKNELSNNDIMNELAKFQTRLTQIKVTLRCEYNAEENII